jgi:hypothetical protein
MINNTNILPRFPDPSEHFGSRVFCPPDPTLSPALADSTKRRQLRFPILCFGSFTWWHELILECDYIINIILVNLLDSDWLKTVPIKH